MFEELEARHGGDADGLERTIGLDLRYVGQEHTLNVRVPSGTGRLAETDLGPVAAEFATEYERRFGTTLTEELELVTVRATTRRSLDPGTGPRAPECEQAGVKRAPTARGSERADVERSGAWRHGLVTCTKIHFRR